MNFMLYKSYYYYYYYKCIASAGSTGTFLKACDMSTLKPHAFVPKCCKVGSKLSNVGP